MKKRVLFLMLSFSMAFLVNSQNDTKSCACCATVYNEFDFWLGQWQVYNVDGSIAGENSIVKDQDNCVLRESWTSATPGYTGTSYNFYNAKSKQWEQIWIDNQGQHLHLKGHRKDNKMVLRTDDETTAEGQTYYHRITWTAHKNGTVQQLWETITNDTEITVAFDGLYKRKQK